MSWTVVRLLLALLVSCATSLGTPAAATPLQLDWRVVNNFALIRGQATQDRFAREAEVYIACIRKTGSTTACSERHPAEGLTTQRYPVRFDARAFRFQDDLLRPTRGVHNDRLSTAERVDVLVTVEGAPADATCTWTLDDHTFRDQPCDRLAITTQIDDESTIVVRVDGSPDVQGRTMIKVRRVIVLALGDSFMSGEGNPHIRRRVTPLRGEHWLEARCHRSLLAASSLAMLRWADDNPQVYVAYLNLACSGATVETGLLGPYRGVKSVAELDNDRSPDDPVDYPRVAQLPSQIDQATAALCRGTGSARTCLTPDLVLLGVGVNDLRFRNVVTTLADQTCAGACQKSLERGVDAGLKRLTGTGAGSYAKAITTIETRLKPRRALAGASPNPTRDDDGQPCRGSIVARSFTSLGLIDERESDWARDRLLVPLNEALGAATGNRPTWAFVAAVAGASATHGFCASKPHFILALEAAIDTGTLHPNAAGHAAVAASLMEPLAAALARPAP
jgi:lysophospholipase L1-like esterase